MAAITAAAYTYLRNTGPVGDWFLEIQTAAGAALARKASSVSDNAGTQTVTLSATFAGSEIGPALPQTTDRVVAFDLGAAGDAMTAAETYAEFTFAEGTDEVTVSLPVEVPQQA